MESPLSRIATLLRGVALPAERRPTHLRVWEAPSILQLRGSRPRGVLPPLATLLRGVAPVEQVVTSLRGGFGKTLTSGKTPGRPPPVLEALLMQ